MLCLPYEVAHLTVLLETLVYLPRTCPCFLFIFEPPHGLDVSGIWVCTEDISFGSCNEVCIWLVVTPRQVRGRKVPSSLRLRRRWSCRAFDFGELRHMYHFRRDVRTSNEVMPVILRGSVICWNAKKHISCINTSCIAVNI